MNTVPLLAKIGIVELAFGVISGWVLIAAEEQPAMFKKLGLVSFRQLVSAHVSILLMGVAVAVAGVIVQPVPDWVVAAILFGSIIDPLLFVPLAFGLDRNGSTFFRVTATLAFISLTIGFVAIAGIAVF